jgi:two-component system, cell cycle response regulator
MKVLVAEDEPVSRRLLAETLKKFGHEVVLATDGGEAWEVLNAPDPPRLALIDWDMPRMDGMELCRRLRARSAGAFVYVILVTARQARDDLVAGLESGANDFLSKPVDREVLRARMGVGERLLAMEAEIRRTTAYLAAMLANVAGAVMLVDHHGKIVYANAPAAELSGVPASEALGLTRDELIERFSQRAVDPAWFRTAVTPGAPVSDDDQSRNLELATPARRFVRWSGQAVTVPGGRGWLDVFQDVTSEVEFHRALAEAANTDHVTGLLNRRGGQQAIAREISRALRDRTPLSFVLLDIDHFKKVNDTHGHAAGDRVLAHVSELLARAIRGYDLAVRWGGEEFLVVLPGVPRLKALVVAERVRIAVSALAVQDLPPVTISAGVAELQPTDTSADAAIVRADETLYRAKSTGRNRVCG